MDLPTTFYVINIVSLLTGVYLSVGGLERLEAE